MTTAVAFRPRGPARSSPRGNAAARAGHRYPKLTDRSIGSKRGLSVLAGAIQLNATEDTGRNLEIADRLVREAAALGAKLIVLPEKWSVLGRPEASWPRRRAARRPLHFLGPRTPRASWASTSSPARSPSASPAQTSASNTSVHVGPDGELRRVYRKLHMFDVEVDGVRYARVRERAAGGRDRASRPRWRRPLGLSICYDVRFPELYGAGRRRRRGHHGPERVHAARRRATTGRCSYGRGRSRISAS